MALVVATGFEFGTTAGWTVGNAGNKVVDTATAGSTVTTSTPRSGTYCLDVTASATSQGVEWTTATIGTSMNRLRAVFAVRFVGSLPGGGVNIAFVDSGNSALVKYDSVGTRLQVQIEGGGSNVNGPTVVADTWYVVEIYFNTSANPNTLDWWVDGAAQTQATSAVPASTIGGFGLGWPFISQTFQCRYDDVAVWTDTADIAGPVGGHKVVLLSVDPAGTVTVNGSAASFSTFTNNGTLDSTFDATTARDAIDEVPPTIGATADGWVQDAAAASDYVQMPMTSYTLSGGETVAGLRMLVPGWATSATATNIRFDAFNGTTAETVFPLGDPNFDNSTTAPAWVCRMLPTLANYDTQAELDGLAFRGGFGTDANPDCGIHAIYAELVVKEASSTDVTGVALGAFTFGSTAAGVPDVAGQAAAALTFTGAASGGAPAVQGQALATLTFGSAAAGFRTTPGTAAATISFGSTAAGFPTTPGTATATFTFGSTTSGVPTVQGQAVGTLTFTGAASGQIVGAVQGQALAAFTFGSTAAGIRGVVGQAPANPTFTATAAGNLTTAGTAAAAVTFTAGSSGFRTLPGQATLTLTFTGAAEGGIVAPYIPAYIGVDSSTSSSQVDSRTLQPAGIGGTTTATHVDL